MARRLAVIPLVSLLLSLGFAQQPPQPTSTGQTTPASDDQENDTGTVMRITVNLVQMDAVVTDPKGNPVTNLKPEDFVALQDGKPQTITHFSYISNESQAQTSSAEGAVQQAPTTTSDVALKREDVRRTIAIVVDDLALSFDSTARVRSAVNKFIDEQVQPGDLVALVSTGKGAGAFQQFTTDKRVMHAAADRIRFNFMNRVGLFSLPSEVLSSKETRVSTPQASEDPNDIERDQYVAGTLGALQWVIRGLREMPGRKSVVLFSEDLSMLGGDGMRSEITEMVRRVVDAANRSSVVFYVIDPRGLVVLGPTAADTSAPDLTRSSLALWASQDGMGVLAYGTGGLLVINNNDMNDALRQVMRDQKGYYLIGYKPDAGTFDEKAGPQFHNIKVQLRPGLRGMKIRSRSGFYGITDEEVRSRARSREQLLTTALFSPFAAKDIRVRLTPLFGEREKIGPFVQTLLHVDARDLKFDEEEGKYKAQVDVVMATFSADGVPVDLTQRTLALALNPNEYHTCLEYGAFFTLVHRVKKAGGYQFRAVIRDVNANKLGSVNQFIEVPDLKKKHLALSGIVLHEMHPDTPPIIASGGVGIPTGGWSAREFRPGTELAYDYEIMNPRREQSSKKPQLQAQFRLLHDGKQLYASKPAAVGMLEGESKYLAVQGAFRLGKHMEPGLYVLQLLVTDDLAPQKYNTATQWVDFEVK